MRYAICFTPPIHDPLSVAAADWLGRNVYSGDLCEQLSVAGCSAQDMAYYTAVPRRYGFHGSIKAPFHLAEDKTESALLKAMMRFAGEISPFEIPDLEVSWLGSAFGLSPRVPCEPMTHLAAQVVQSFDEFRAPFTEQDIARLDADKLTATQFSNLHRWGDPFVMEEYRFHMMLTGPMTAGMRKKMEGPVRTQFEAVLAQPVKVASLALFIEPGAGAPLRVHSQHPLGKLSPHKPTGRFAPPSASATSAATPAREVQMARAMRRLTTGA
ncbi:DUF1045 domain-containing protein [Rhizobium sp. Leaf341]|uniref:DUF1045 domain-containing protein n=1 Tax=Rhizobium sp. Leaf341 TaxID=1736344 RepID=UPI00071460D5|nr:DUF1045 domain-containing protein [Rhizobium sp. Leaf341]KQR69171.1 hypothetical protein ASG03_08180 [Rhizobium sp. Leaf341]